MKKRKEDKPPKGGWMAPPGNTRGLAAIATLIPGKGKKKAQWRKNKLTKKEKKAHKKFQSAMAKADKKGKWTFKW